MKKTFIYSLVVATLLVGCGDKESGSIAESVKSAANGAVEKTKEVAKDAGHAAVEATKEGRSAVDAAKVAVTDATSKTVEAATSAVDSAKEAGSKAVEKASEVVASTTTAATAAVASATEAVTSAGDSAAGKAAYAKCVACHGPNAEKKALGASQVIAGWDTAKTEAAMKGYKDGSYGGAMKGVMKGQVVSMSDADIANVAAYISTLNK